MPKLIVVGSGIKSIAHLTEEAKRVIQQADKVLYLLNEDHMKQWVQQEAKQSESLETLYFAEPSRADAYQNITNYIVETYQQHDVLCVVFYGHPTLFADSALQAVKDIKASGGDAIILPAVSSMDCLFADLQVDPSNGGLFCIDATELLIFKRHIDTKAHVILFQAANLGTTGIEMSDKIPLLVEYLKRFYTSDHQVCIYEAAVIPGKQPRIEWVSLVQLKQSNLNLFSTVYLAPV